MNESDVDQASVSGTVNKGFVDIPLGQLENQSFDESPNKTGKKNSYLFSHLISISGRKINFLPSHFIPLLYSSVKFQII